MIKGLTSHKVRQSPPKPPVKKCSPPPEKLHRDRRGPKTSPESPVPLTANEVLGFSKERFSSISNETWNAVVSVLRNCTLLLLRSLQEFETKQGQLLDLLQDTIPQWTYHTGRQVLEAVLVDKTGHLGNEICCDQCQEQVLKFKGYSPTYVTTALGRIHYSRARYGGSPCSHNRYPLDCQLGLNDKHRMLPALQELAAEFSAHLSYPQALKLICSTIPADFCQRTQEDVTATVALAARQEQKEEHDNAFSTPSRCKWPDKDLVDPGEVSTVAVVATDGGFCSMKGKNAPEREFKLGVVGWLHPKTRSRPEGEPPKVCGKRYSGSFKGADFAMQLTELEYHRLGLCKAKVVQVIGDAASWIWNRAPSFMQDGQELILTLDLYHVRERIGKTADEFFGHSTQESRDWYKARDDELLEGKLSNFFRAFTQLAKKADAQNRPEISKLIIENRSYFHKRKPMLNYPDFLARGLLVGSGMVEGGIRFVGKDRLDKTGAKWLEPGAENILCLRALIASERWDTFKKVRKEKLLKNYAKLESTWLGKVS